MRHTVGKWIMALVLGAAMVGTAAGVAIGVPAPAFDVPLLQGDARLTLEQFRGKVVLLDFWASWCTPCGQSLPLYEKLRAELAGRGFELVAIGLDEDAEDGRAFLARFDVHYPVGSDPEGAVASLYALKGMPYAVLIDRDGVVRATHVGFKPADIAALRAKIEALLEPADE